MLIRVNQCWVYVSITNRASSKYNKTSRAHFVISMWPDLLQISVRHTHNVHLYGQLLWGKRQNDDGWMMMRDSHIIRHREETKSGTASEHLLATERIILAPPWEGNEKMYKKTLYSRAYAPYWYSNSIQSVRKRDKLGRENIHSRF